MGAAAADGTQEHSECWEPWEWSPWHSRSQCANVRLRPGPIGVCQHFGRGQCRHPGIRSFFYQLLSSHPCASCPAVPIHPGRGAGLQSIPEDPLPGAAGGSGTRARLYWGRQLLPGPAPRGAAPAEGHSQVQVTAPSHPSPGRPCRGVATHHLHLSVLITNTTTAIGAHGKHHSSTLVREGSTQAVSP